MDAKQKRGGRRNNCSELKSQWRPSQSRRVNTELFIDGVRDALFYTNKWRDWIKVIGSGNIVPLGKGQNIGGK